MQARAGNNCISRHTPPDNGNNDDEKDDEEQLIIWSIIMNDDEYNNILFDNKYRRGSHLTAHMHTSVTHPHGRRQAWRNYSTRTDCFLNWL